METPEQISTPTSPLTGSGSVIRFAIFSNGKEIDSAWQVLSTDTYTETGKIPGANIRLLDGNPDTDSFPISDAGAFAPGSSVEIKMGYGSYMATVFTGTVASQNLQVSPANGSVLLINCLGDKPVDSTPDLTGQPLLSITYGVSVLDMDVTTCPADTLPPSAPPDFAHIQGSLSFQGSSMALPGKLIQLSNTGKRFNGKAYIRGVKHTLQEGNWITTVELGI
jgi:phage protein D